MTHNRTAPRPFIALRPTAEADDQQELIIYGRIGGDCWGDDGTTGRDIVEQLNALPDTVAQLNVRINSFGGDVDDGYAIYNALRRHPAKKVVTVDGVAMSAASLIAMAGDEVLMPETSVMMIHAPASMAFGNAEDMRQAADALDVHSRAMVGAYARKASMSVDEVLTLVTDGKDHYYTGAEAVEAGFADALIDDPQNADDDSAQAFAQRMVAQAEAMFAESPMAGSPVATMAVTAMARHPRVIHTVDVAVAADHMNSSAGEDVILNTIARNRTRVASALQSATSASADPAAPTAPEASTEESPMTTANDQPSAPTAAEIHASLHERNDEIRAVLKPYMQREGISDLLIDSLSDPTASIDSVRARALELVGQDTTPSASHVEMGADETDKFRAGVSQAIMARAGLAQMDGANPYRGLNLREIARTCAQRAGHNTGGMDVRQVVATAFTSTSDFPNVLANTAQAALLKGYEESTETFPQFTSVGTLTDFKETTKAGLGLFSDLDEVPEGGEYKYGTFGDHGAKIKLATYGKLFAITRQAIINDDMGAFTDVPRKMGRAAKRTIGNLVFAVLTENANMADGNKLFSAAHNNLLTGSDITTDSVEAMAAAMAKQKMDGHPINVPLAKLIVPVALRGTANAVRQSQYAVGGSGAKNQTVANTVRDTFEVIADARLDASSAKGWYGVADANLYDVIEVSYLDGQQAPYLEQKDGWDVDGTEFKVRIDAGVHAFDYRGLASNPGA